MFMSINYEKFLNHMFKPLGVECRDITKDPIAKIDHYHFQVNQTPTREPFTIVATIQNDELQRISFMRDGTIVMQYVVNGGIGDIGRYIDIMERHNFDLESIKKEETSNRIICSKDDLRHCVVDPIDLYFSENVTEQGDAFYIESVNKDFTYSVEYVSEKDSYVLIRRLFREDEMFRLSVDNLDSSYLFAFVAQLVFVNTSVKLWGIPTR
jgi:hypothetical protein